MFINGSGNVGIGTSTLAGTLDVLGTGVIQSSTNTSTAFQVENSNGAPVFSVDTTPSFGATTTNYIVNPGFEVNTYGWSASGTGATISRVTIHKYAGVAALKLDNYGGGAAQGATMSLFSPSPTAGTYNLSFYARTDTTSSTFSTLMAGYNNSSSFTSCSLNSTAVSNQGWTRYNCTFTSSGNVANIFIGQSDGVSRTFYLDAIQLELGSAPTPYSVGNIQLRGVVNSPVSFQNLSNSVSAFQIQDQTGTSNTFMVDTLNGKISIGTTTPNVRFAIQGASGSSLDLFDVSSSTGQSALHITSGNFVGIGTTTPTAELSIAGISGSNALINITSSTGASLMYMGANGRIGVGSSSPNATLAVQGVISLPTSDVFQAASSSTAVLFNVTSSGRVGIGSSSPVAMLSEQSVSGTYVDLHDLVFSGSGPISNQMVNGLKVQGYTSYGAGGLFNGENLAMSGSGTATGTIVALNISGITAGVATETAISIGAGWDSYFNIATTATTTLINIQGTANRDTLDISSTTGASEFRITSTGRIGINSSTPSATLAITTQSGVNAFTVASSTGATTTYFTITSIGNVGIGTSSPAARFAVAANCFNFASTTAATSKGVCTDYAEIYPSSEPVNMGDIVSSGQASNSVDPDGLIKDADQAYDSGMIGVVSTNPAVVVEGNSVQLMNGADYNFDSMRPAIALAGRVPVKIVPGQPIHVGDFITSSGIPGVGMKAVKAGVVVGQALQNYDPATDTSANPTVMVFVSPGFFNGSDIEAVVSGLAIDPASEDLNALKILQYFVANPVASASSTQSEIFTDKLLSGVEVVTPKVTSKSLTVDDILPSLEKNINVILPDDGQFIVGNGVTSGLMLDSAGDATFGGSVSAPSITTGKITAGEISSPEISNLNNLVSGLSGVSSSTAAMLLNLSDDFNNFKATTTEALTGLQSGQQDLAAKVDKLSVSLDVLLKTGGGLSADGSVELPNGLSVDSITALNGELSLISDVNFVGRPYFTTDTAGFGLVSQGEQRVDVTFDRPVSWSSQ